MPRTFLVHVLCVSLLLLPLASWSQQAPTTSSHRRSHGSGGGGSSSHGGDSSGTPAMSSLPCPKGFTAQQDSGPHLVLSSPSQGKAGRGKGSSQSAVQPTAKSTMGRRCVPDKPKKTAAASAKASARTP